MAPRPLALVALGVIVLVAGLAQAAEPIGSTTTFAGDGHKQRVDGMGIDASFDHPWDISGDERGRLFFVADRDSNSIRRISSTASVETFAGCGHAGYIDNSKPSVACFDSPTGVAYNSKDDILFIADSKNHRIRRITAASHEDGSAHVDTIAGTGVAEAVDGFGTLASFRNPYVLHYDRYNKHIYVGDDWLIRRIDCDGQVTTLARVNDPTLADRYAGRPAITGMFFDYTANRLYVADGWTNRVKVLDVTKSPAVLSLYAGGGGRFLSRGERLSAGVGRPWGVAVNPYTQTVYALSSEDNRVLKVTPEGFIESVAGSGQYSFRDGVAEQASFRSPQGGHFVITEGAMYVTDADNHRVRRIVVSGYVASVSPSAGTKRGGYLVTISGGNLGNGAAGDIYSVLLAGAQATIVSQSADQVVVTAGASTRVGRGNVVVVSRSKGMTVGPVEFDLGFTYLDAPEPYIATVLPNNGPLYGGNKVTITGSDLASGTGSDITSVYLGEVPATIVSKSPYSVVVTAGAAASAGTRDVVVTSGTGSTRRTLAYTYNPKGSILGLEPPSGPLEGGNMVTVRGSSLGSGRDIYEVVIGGKSVPPVSQTNKRVTVIAPPSAKEGPVDVAVRSISYGETSMASAYSYEADGFLTLADPELSRFSGGIVVTIHGSRFSDGSDVSSVAINKKEATILSQKQGEVVVRVPSGSDLGLDPRESAYVKVTVTSRSRGATSSSSILQYVAQGVIMSVSPNLGPVEGGNQITIAGSHLGDGDDITAVTFNGVGAKILLQSATKIVVEVPAADGPGTTDISVTSSAYGQTSAKDAYRYVQKGTIKGIVPDEGPLEGGNSVTITGAYLAAPSGDIVTCRIGSQLGKVTDASASHVVCVVPEGPRPGLVDVEVASLLSGLVLAEDAYTYLAPPPPLSNITAVVAGAAGDGYVMSARSAPNGVSAEYDLTVTMPTRHTVVLGKAVGANAGASVKYQWQQTNGDRLRVANVDSADLALCEMDPGYYTFRLKVTDGEDTDATVVRLRVNGWHERGASLLAAVMSAVTMAVLASASTATLVGQKFGHVLLLVSFVQFLAALNGLSVEFPANVVALYDGLAWSILHFNFPWEDVRQGDMPGHIFRRGQPVPDEDMPCPLDHVFLWTPQSLGWGAAFLLLSAVVGALGSLILRAALGRAALPGRFSVQKTFFVTASLVFFGIALHAFRLLRFASHLTTGGIYKAILAIALLVLLVFYLLWLFSALRRLVTDFRAFTYRAGVQPKMFGSALAGAAGSLDGSALARSTDASARDSETLGARGGFRLMKCHGDWEAAAGGEARLKMFGWTLRKYRGVKGAYLYHPLLLVKFLLMGFVIGMFKGAEADRSAGWTQLIVLIVLQGVEVMFLAMTMPYNHNAMNILAVGTSSIEALVLLFAAGCHAQSSFAVSGHLGSALVGLAFGWFLILAACELLIHWYVRAWKRREFVPAKDPRSIWDEFPSYMGADGGRTAYVSYTQSPAATTAARLNASVRSAASGESPTVYGATAGQQRQVYDGPGGGGLSLSAAFAQNAQTSTRVNERLVATEQRGSYRAL
eukprot:tig00000880_g5192.t1